MSIEEKVIALAEDPAALELLYQTAREAGEETAFQTAIDAQHADHPDNLLFAAWFYRLRQASEEVKTFAVAWGWVIPLAVANGLLFWWLSDFDRFMLETVGGQTRPREIIPLILLLAGPISAAFVLTFLTAVGRRPWWRSAGIAAALLGAAGYVILFYPQAGTRSFQEQYLVLMVLHIALLAWAGVGTFLIFENRNPASRFAFLIKSLEVFITGGLFVIAGGLFSGITIGLFAALNIELSDIALRLMFAGGGGLLPVVAAAVIYNPRLPPAAQAFDEGLSKLIALLMRFLLPLTLLVLVIYLGFIPFNFFEPFDNRDVLIIYNGMLFAVIALLMGATPIRLGDLSHRLARWLRPALIAVAALALIVSIYALTAILYRTAFDRLTPNRLTFIGWNITNIVLLSLILYFQARSKTGDWLPALYRAYSAGTVAYAAWTLFVILALPWLFGIDQGQIDVLPERVQELVFEQAAPLLVKCSDSPHIYLLEDGQKRWIETIETFNDRGYLWRDVNFIDCEDLRAVPDGVPIPPDAGPPPQP